MMMFILNQLTRLHDDESGQGLVEYLLILALVAFAATAGMGSLASGLNSAFSQPSPQNSDTASHSLSCGVTCMRSPMCHMFSISA